MSSNQSSPEASLPDASHKLRAVLSDDGKGGYIIRTEGVFQLVLRGADLKEAMNQLVKAVNALKKSNRLPVTFDFTKSLEVHFE